MGNRYGFLLNNMDSGGTGLHLSQIKMLLLYLIVIHSLVYGPRVLQGVSETHTVFPSAAFCIWIFDAVDRSVQSWTADRQLPLDSALEEMRQGKLFQLRSAPTEAQNTPSRSTCFRQKHADKRCSSVNSHCFPISHPVLGLCHHRCR